MSESAMQEMRARAQWGEGEEDVPRWTPIWPARKIARERDKGTLVPQ
jgi:hypothetical protein